MHDWLRTWLSMSSEDWAVMSEAFGRAPYKVDSRGNLLVFPSPALLDLAL